MEFTSKSDTYSKCFHSVDTQFNRWQRKLNKAIYACFRKIRIKGDNERKPSRIDELMNKRKEILKKKSKTQPDEIEVDTIEKYISEEIADKKLEKLENIIGTFNNNSYGTNYTNVWKQLRKACPKNVKPLPTGVENKKGKVITNFTEKEAVILEHFEHRMRKREIKDEVKDINVLNNELF